jgi:hypothetical protein
MNPISHKIMVMVFSSMHSILINYQQSIWQAAIYKEVATRSMSLHTVALQKD